MTRDQLDELLENLGLDRPGLAPELWNLSAELVAMTGDDQDSTLHAMVGALVTGAGMAWD